MVCREWLAQDKTLASVSVGIVFTVLAWAKSLAISYTVPTSHCQLKPSSG